MKIHEYQGKAILAPFGVPIPRGKVATTAAEAGAVARELGGPVSVVKAQIHAGGRGKGGGVKVAKSPDEVRRHASAILGMQLKTHQTGPEGQKVRRLLIEEGADIASELYVGMVVDRDSRRIRQGTWPAWRLHVGADRRRRPAQPARRHDQGVRTG